MAKKKIKAIIFDFDGVIADTIFFILREASDLVKKNLQIKLTNEQIIDIIKSVSFRELLKKSKIPFFKLPLIFLQIKNSQKKLNKVISEVKAFPGVKKVINDLKKDYQLAIISSNSRKNIKDFLLNKKINIFDDIVTSYFVFDKSKLIKSFLKKHNLKNEEVIYIGDEIRDVLACKKAKIKMIGVSWGLAGEEELKKVGVDFFVKKPKEILGIVVKRK